MLLLKASDEAPRSLSIFGQENEGSTAALARMNMILHNNATAKIWKGNTISDPQWKDANGQLKTFDFAVANPPFSNKNWTSGINPKEDEFSRFEWGIPPEKNGDYTFLLHIIKSLKSRGRGAVILPHGVLFRGNAESRIRENLIRQGYIKAIIGLPANLFYGTGIPACIIVMRELIVEKGEKSKESPDLVIGRRKYKAELISPELIIQRFYAKEQAAIDELQSQLDLASQNLEGYIEENSGEDGNLIEALNAKDKINKASVTARLKLATDDEEVAALKQAKKLFDAEAGAKKAFKEAQEALLLAVFKHYPELSEADDKTLIVDDKWLATLRAAVQADIERVIQRLAKRVKELEERYAEPLPAIEASVEELGNKVAEHLKAMGLNV